MPPHNVHQVHCHVQHLSHAVHPGVDQLTRLEPVGRQTCSSCGTVSRASGKWLHTCLYMLARMHAHLLSACRPVMAQDTMQKPLHSLLRYRCKRSSKSNVSVGSDVQKISHFNGSERFLGGLVPHVRLAFEGSAQLS